MLLIRLLQKRTNPGLEIGASLGPWVLRLRPDGVQGCEANSERHLLNIHLGNQIVLVRDLGRELEQLQQGVAGEAPSLGVPCSKRIRVGKSLGEGEDSRLAVQRSRKLLSVLKNDIEINGREEASDTSVRILENSSGVRKNLLWLHLLRDLHDKVGVVSLVIVGGDEMVESDEAER